jgi:hypothetical protein
MGRAAQLVRTQEWDPLTERRVRLSSGLEPVKDSSRLLEHLIAAVRGL